MGPRHRPDPLPRCHVQLIARNFCGAAARDKNPEGAAELSTAAAGARRNADAACASRIDARIGKEESRPSSGERLLATRSTMADLAPSPSRGPGSLVTPGILRSVA
jgi:hypothetical protein